MVIPQALVPAGLGLTALLVGVRLAASLRMPSASAP
jgi:hypothetical protein